MNFLKEYINLRLCAPHNSAEFMEKLVRNIEKYRVEQESWTQTIVLNIVR